ncbi:MAG TPA: hypothetical protein PKM25_17435, partial [Candidatus Ozemobacteraceae bacterium]|nr:hypothetical protein [Candidatus Ozemobacteraceae bacterium]
MRRLRSCSIAFILLFAAAALLLKWFWNSPMELPTPAASLLKEKIHRETGALFEYDSLELNGSTGEGTLSKAALRNASSTPIVTADRIHVKLASGTSVIDIISGNTAIDELKASDIDIDLQKIPQLLADVQSESSGSAVPINRFSLKNIRIATGFGRFLIDSADIGMRRVNGDMTGRFQVTELPFGGTASVSFRVPFDFGTGTIALDWTGASIPKTASIYPLLWFWGITIENGSADLALQWSGNVKERVSKPDSNLDALVRRELKGSIGIQNLVVAWNGFKSTFSATLHSRDPFGSWNCAIDGRSGSETASVNINLDGSGQEWGIGA